VANLFPSPQWIYPSNFILRNKIWQEIIISYKSPGHVHNITFWDILPEFKIEPIRAREESLYGRPNSNRFTCEMANFERRIRREWLIYSNCPCHIFHSTFCDVQTIRLNWFDPSTERFSKKFLSFLTQNGPNVTEAPCTYMNIALMQSNRVKLNRDQIFEKVAHLKFIHFCVDFR